MVHSPNAEGLPPEIAKPPAPQNSTMPLTQLGLLEMEEEIAVYAQFAALDLAAAHRLARLRGRDQEI